MVAQFETNQSLTSRLIQGLSLIPRDWALTPVLGNKAPYRADWQKEIISRRQLSEIVAKGDTIIRGGNFTKTYPQGYGLKTGPVSGGILAIDCDGQSAQEKLNQMGELPQTVAFTSGRDGRCQYLVRVPEDYWGIIKTIKIKTGVKDEDGKEQLLELRWDGCQSVLPPSAHPVTGSYQWVNSPQACNVAECPTWLIEYFLNQSTPTTATPSLLHLPTSDVPLYQCLSKDDRALIDSGTGEGDRNDKGAKLARNLIGTATRLNQLGHRFEGEPRILFDNYCSRCSPPLGNKEADQIWKSAEKSHPSATLTDDAIDNCVKSWQRQQGIFVSNAKPGPSVEGAAQNNVVPHPSVKNQPIDFDSIKAEYLQLLAKGAGQAEVERFKIATREQFPLLQPGELSKLLDATGDEFYKSENLLTEAEELLKLVEASEQTLHLSEYLPPSLANPLSEYCEWQKIRHAVVLTSLLTSMSSLHKVGTEMVLHRNLGFTVPPTLYSAIVAESGSKKSPIFRAMAKLPLGKMRQTRWDEYEENFQDYQSEVETWEAEKANLKKGEKPTAPKPTEPPKPPIFFFTDATGEGIKSQAQAAPDKALFLLCDELAALFGSQNAYRGGRGSDKQDLLSYYDGTGATVLRAGGVKIDVPKIYLSILGTIQPDILKKIMGNTSDADGSWSRFLFAVQPNIPTTLCDDLLSGVNSSEILSGYFEKIFSLPITEYSLSREAFKMYQPFYNRLEQLRVSHPSPGFRAVYAKAEGLVGRLALNLHILHEIAAGRTPSTEVGADMMQRAIALMKFYIGQVRLIHATVNDSDGIAPHIHKVIELSKRKQLCGEEGWVKAGDIQRNCTRSKRPTPAEARGWMIQASELGYGIVRGEGIKVEFKSGIDKTRQHKQKIDSVIIAESVDKYRVEKKEDKIVQIDDLIKLDNIAEELPPPMDEKRQIVNSPHLFVYSTPEKVDMTEVDPVATVSIVPPIECLISTEPPQVANSATGDAIEFAEPVQSTERCSKGDCTPQTPTLTSVDTAEQIPPSPSVDTAEPTPPSPSVDTAEQIPPSPSVDTAEQIPTLPSVDTAEQIPTLPTTPTYKVGDRIMCYPTEVYADRKKQIKATVTNIEYISGYLQFCEVEYFDKGANHTAMIGGGSADWILRRVSKS